MAITVAMADLDDCAILDLTQPVQLAIGSDYIRGRQFDLFRLRYLSYFDLGYYLMGANLSDIAAMGALPIGATVIFRYPSDMTKAQALHVIDGMATACECHGPCPVLGGDTGGATDLVLGATVLGRVVGRPLLRSNARPGDRVYVLGYPGRAAAAQLVLKNPHRTAPFPLSPEDVDSLLQQWRRPQPLLVAGQRLSASGYRIACQDTSDGVKTTLRQIAQASKVNLLIHERGFAVEPLLVRVAEFLDVDPLELFLRASVDFALLFTLPQDVMVENVFPQSEGPPLFYLGEVLAGDGQLLLARRDGTVVQQFPGTEYRQ